MSTSKRKTIIQFLRELLEKFDRLYSVETEQYYKDFRIFIIKDLLKDINDDNEADNDALEVYLNDIINFGTNNGTPAFLIYTKEIDFLFEKYSTSIITLLATQADYGQPTIINANDEYPSILVHKACQFYYKLLLDTYVNECCRKLHFD